MDMSNLSMSLLVLFLLLYFKIIEFFPQISYINVNNNDIVLMQYRKNTIAVTTGSINVQDLKVPMNIDNVYSGLSRRFNYESWG